MHPQRCASERSIKQVIFNLPNGFVGDDDADAIGDGSEESQIKLVDIRCNGLTHRPANLAQSSTPIGQRAGTIPDHTARDLPRSASQRVSLQSKVHPNSVSAQ